MQAGRVKVGRRQNTENSGFSAAMSAVGVVAEGAAGNAATAAAVASLSGEQNWRENFQAKNQADYVEFW